MAIIYGNAISIGYATSGSSAGGTYSIWLTLPAVAASTTFTAVKDGVSVASTYISSIKAAKITLPADNPEGDWTITGTVGGKTVSKTVTVKSGTVDYFVDFRNDFIPLVGDLAVGNLVTFDNKSWRVVHQEGTHWYLANENIVSQTPFGSSNAYKGSTIASVAATYENEQLSKTAKEYCADVTVNNVTAKVFVPSYEQVNGGFSYYNSSTNRICQLNGANSIWWTSSPNGSYVYRVHTDGALNYADPSNGLGFRPHICIDTSLSGSATEETVTLAGTWMFNEPLSAPESLIDENINFTGKEMVTSTPKNFTGARISTTQFDATPTGALPIVVYKFAEKTWVNKYKYLTFPAGATASDEFIAWLKTNATKQS